MQDWQVIDKTGCYPFWDGAVVIFQDNNHLPEGDFIVFESTTWSGQQRGALGMAQTVAIWYVTLKKPSL